MNTDWMNPAIVSSGEKSFGVLSLNAVALRRKISKLEARISKRLSENVCIDDLKVKLSELKRKHETICGRSHE